MIIIEIYSTHLDAAAGGELVAAAGDAEAGTGRASRADDPIEVGRCGVGELARGHQLQPEAGARLPGHSQPC